MKPEIDTFFARSRAWIESARDAGWLTESSLSAFDRLERATPADLFRSEAVRPLVVAFFGGTGVGKSSLLNRLAGSALARTGVERPTSREVTLYCHEETPLGELPPGLIERVRIARHTAAARRDIVWIDAPDIDSVETSNRELVFAWLPHVDLVLYVVSPERYRDDAGWRALLARGRMHGWMFIMNRCDEGEPGQLDDFAAILGEAGFADPLVFATSCAPAAAGGQLLLGGGDQFERIEHTVRDALRRHGVREIERIGLAGRLAELDDQLAALLGRIGDEAVWRGLQKSFADHCDRFATALESGVQWPIRAAAARFSTRNEGAAAWLLARVRGERRGATGDATARRETEGDPAPAHADSGDISALAESLWDEWAASRLGELIDELEVDAHRAGLAAEPIRSALAPVVERAGKSVVGQAETSLRAAVARPGSAIQRAARRVTGFLTVAGPGSAVLWIWWQVFQGYYRASSGATAYLGSEFLIHSGMLVFFSWVIPFAADRLLAPSLERAAREGLSAGFAEALAGLRAELESRLCACARDAGGLRAAGAAIRGDLSAATRVGPSAADDSVLSRMIPAVRQVARE